MMAMHGQACAKKCYRNRFTNKGCKTLYIYIYIYIYNTNVIPCIYMHGVSEAEQSEAECSVFAQYL